MHGYTKAIPIDTDVNLAADSNQLAPSEKAIKTWVNNALIPYQPISTLASNVATLSANNSAYLGGTAAAGYQTTAGLASNVATLSANNSAYLGGTEAAGYQTTAGLAANVATLSANNSSYLGGLAAASYANTSAPSFTTSIAVGANVVANTTAVLVGNSTANLIINSTVITLGNATVNSTVNTTTFSGTSNNALYLGGTAAAGYQTTAGLASNVATLSANNSAYLGGLAAASYANTSAPSISTSVSVGANVVANTTAILVGNSTANLIINSTVITLGNATVNSTVNTTTFSGTSNNSSYLGGLAAASYANTSAPSFTTSIAVGANVVANTTAILVGNSTANLIINSTAIVVGNSTVNLTTNASSVTIGGSYLNANGINVPNGATGNLGIRYGAANTGVYLSGTVLWHVTNGTARWGVGAAIVGALTYAPGMGNSNSLVANTTVIYPNKQDTDTGLGAGAANTLTFIVTGNEKVRLNSNGMGINTVAPAYTLDISGTTRSTSMIIGTTDLYGNSLTFTSSTGPDVIDAIAIATFRSADYIYSMKNNSANAYQTGKILVLQNGTTGQLSEYAVQSSNGSMGTFSTGSNATHVTLLFTPGASTSYTVRFTRTALTV